MDLPGYDDWKLATPPEYEREGCPKCGNPLNEEGYCDNCDQKDDFEDPNEDE